MSKQDIECQNGLFSRSANVKIGFRMSNQPISTQCECENRILNVKIAYFSISANDKIGFLT